MYKLVLVGHLSVSILEVDVIFWRHLAEGGGDILASRGGGGISWKKCDILESCRDVIPSVARDVISWNLARDVISWNLERKSDISASCNQSRMPIL
ncbi:hypothetical protein Bpfe_003837 [Biomphalaria pfeifferi]|uniref:Uncharacterized protein n=1 Tax=Biomphalaria pfeifferi TaxID=112525 RepID=A0AAD8C6K2_BIOPF|nr:hypothetical protein Bpfe_003837 [Biomphalaria pfeifferi]